MEMSRGEASGSGNEQAEEHVFGPREGKRMPLPLNSALKSLKPSGIRRFSQLAAATPGCVSLTLGEPGENTPDVVKACVAQDLAANMTHYPPNNGHAFLKEAIVEDLSKRGMTYAPDEVIVTEGATEALFATLTAMLNPGDEVIVPQPAFILYESITLLNRATVVPLDTRPTAFQIREADLRAAVSPRTKAIVLTTPNNPTGCVLDAESLAAVAAVARETGMYVICDDVYGKLSYEDGFQGFASAYPELKPQVIAIDSFSKPYAMTGWRLGWLAADSPLAAEIGKVHQYAISCVPSFLQHAAVEALRFDVSDMRESYRARRDYTVGRLRDMGLDTVQPQGAFYAFPSVEKFGLTSEDFCTRAILEAGVACVPGSLFGGEGHIRISYACDMERLELGLNRLEAFVRELAC